MAGQQEKRTEERFPVTGDVTCPFLAPVGEGIGPIKVRDVSMQGIGLLSSRRIEPGTQLAIVLENKARGFSKTVLVRVTHATPQGGAFLVGGTFNTPLTYQEMTTFVL